MFMTVLTLFKLIQFSSRNGQLLADQLYILLTCTEMLDNNQPASVSKIDAKSTSKKSANKGDASKSRTKRELNPQLELTEKLESPKVKPALGEENAIEIKQDEEDKPSKKSELIFKEEIKQKEKNEEMLNEQKLSTVQKNIKESAPIKEDHNNSISNVKQFSNKEPGQITDGEKSKSKKKVTTQSKKTRIVPSNSKQSKTEVKDISSTDLLLKKSQNKEQTAEFTHQTRHVKVIEQKKVNQQSNIHLQETINENNQNENKKLETIIKSTKRSKPSLNEADQKSHPVQKSELKKPDKSEKKTIPGKSEKKTIYDKSEKKEIAVKSQRKPSKSAAKSGVKKVKLNHE